MPAAVFGDQRFPLVCVVPIAGTPGEWAQYPRLGPGSTGPRQTSFAMIDPQRSVAERRVRRAYGGPCDPELIHVGEGLRLRRGLG